MMLNKEVPSSASRIICRVCQKQFAQYTCPRCNSRYCSLHCYKGHSLRCTESFMRENVMDKMRQLQPNDEMRWKMLDILKRFHSEEEMDSEEDDTALSDETVRKFLSGENLGLEDLSPEEMKRFQRAVAAGELSKMIKPWEPWWLKPSSRRITLSQDGMRLINPVGGRSDELITEDSEGDVCDVPAGPETPLPPISKLSRAAPSPFLPVHFVDIIYSYCFTLRLYNGDWHSDPLGAVTVVSSISSILGECSQPETVAEALGHCLEAACSPVYKHSGGLQFGLGILDDVISLLSLGKDALICALCDLRRLVASGEKVPKDEKTRGGTNRNKLKLAERKLYFLTCWTREQVQEVFSCTGNLVRMVKEELSSKDVNFILEKPKGGVRGRALIEEV